MLVTMETLENFPACGYMAVRTLRQIDFGDNSTPQVQPAGWDMLMFNPVFSGRPGILLSPSTATDGACDAEIYIKAKILEDSDADVSDWDVFKHYMGKFVTRAESMTQRLRDIDAAMRDLFEEARYLQKHPGTEKYPRAALALDGIRRYESMCTSFGPRSQVG